MNENGNMKLVILKIIFMIESKKKKKIQYQKIINKIGQV